MTNVPIPPDSEQARQKLIHQLRMERVNAVDRLAKNDFADNSTLFYVTQLNAQIDTLKYIREPLPDTDPEPTIEDIKTRAEDWYWDPWEEDGDE